MKFARWLSDSVEHVADGLRFLPNLKFTAPFVAATVAYWTLNALGLWMLALHSGFPAFSYGEACVALGVVALGVLVPNAPGYFGAYQLSFYAALAMFYPPDQVIGPGAALVFVVYCCQMLVMIVGAGIGALLDESPKHGEHGGLAEKLATEAPRE